MPSDLHFPSNIYKNMNLQNDQRSCMPSDYISASNIFNIILLPEWYYQKNQSIFAIMIVYVSSFGKSSMFT